MKKQLLLVLLFMTCVLIDAKPQVQQVLATAGGNGRNGEMIIDWSLGEPFVACFSAGNSSLTQGFLQPTLVVTAISESEDPTECIYAYPNPSQDVLIIQTDDAESKKLQYLLFNLNGKLLEKKPLVKTHVVINMANYPAGVYLLKIVKPDKELKTFEIIKH